MELTLDVKGPKTEKAIPPDWTERPLKDCLKEPIKYGIGAAAVDFNSTLPTYLRITDINDNGKLIKEGLKSVNHPASAKYFLQKGDLVFARTGASVGKSYAYNENDGPLVYAGFLVKVSPDPKILLSQFLKGFVSTKRYWDWVLLMSMRSGQPGINGQEYASLRVPIPSTIGEQKAIATALSDVDELINHLEKLIEKKKAIKQGVMQQLMKPYANSVNKPASFINEWIKTCFRDILDLVTDYTANGSFESLKSNVKYYTERNYAVLVRTTDLDKSKFEPERFTDFEGYNYLSKTSLFGGEIIMANVGSIGKVFRVPFYHMAMTLAPNTYLLKFKKSISEDFMFQWMLTSEFKNKLMSKVGSTTLLAINKDNLRDIELTIPTSHEKQQQVANLLNDLDGEIQILFCKRQKLLRVKLGMMQELLTGKTRLV